MKKLFCLLWLALLFASAGAQDSQQICASHLLHERMMQTDADYRSAFVKMQQETGQKVSMIESGGMRLAVTTIPVVVHIIHLGEAVGTGSNLSDAAIMNAINGLNDRFRNAIGAGIDVGVEFCLAKKNPNGQATTGINRVNGSGVPKYAVDGISWDNVNGADEYAVKSLSIWPRASYYNIWVVHKIFGNVLGYAYYPTASIVDGVVIEAAEMNYNSLVLAHEVGHGFNLAHTFEGDFQNQTCPGNTNCSTMGDFICDTPPHKQNDCGNNNPCSNTGIWNNSRYNYMSYCFPSMSLGRFTDGQKTRVQAALLLPERSGLVASTGCEISECNPADCNDFNICTIDNCNNGTCVYTSLCDDGDDCTIDNCVNGVCTYTAIPDCTPCKQVNAPIKDFVTLASSLTVSNIQGEITDLNVKIDLAHTFLEDLTITLEGPSGVTITLFNRSCGGMDNMKVIFDDEGTIINCPPSSFAPTKPHHALSVFKGDDINGLWTLRIRDDGNLDEGTLSSWCLIPTVENCNIQEIELQTGWNLISGYIIPDNVNPFSVFQDILSEVIIVKTNSGQSFIPSLQLNTMGNWDFKQAYKVKVASGSTLSLSCSMADPATPLHLNANWNAVPFLHQTAMPVATAFSGLGNDVLVVKNNLGQTYIPSFGINSIGSLQPGQGYQVKMAAAATLTYPTAKFYADDSFGETPKNQHFTINHNSGANATIIFPANFSADVMDGDEIGIFDEDGVLAGSAVVQSSAFAVTVWGDDASTPTKEGMSESSRYIGRIWKKGYGFELEFPLVFSEGSDRFKVDAVSVVETGVQVGYKELVHQQVRVQPNPFSSSVSVIFSLHTRDNVQLKIYDLVGKEVAKIEAPFTEGEQKIDWNGSDSNGNICVPGIYLLRLQAGDFKHDSKVVKW